MNRVSAFLTALLICVESYSVEGWSFDDSEVKARGEGWTIKTTYKISDGYRFYFDVLVISDNISLSEVPDEWGFSIRILIEHNVDEIKLPNNYNGRNEIYFDGTIAQWCSKSYSFGTNNTSKIYIGDVKIYDEDYPEPVSVVIPDGVTEIKDYCFDFSLESITIPTSVKKIGSYSYSAQNVYYEGKVTDWIDITRTGSSRCENLYFQNQKVTDVVIPDGTTDISDFAFEGYDGIQNIHLPRSLKHIGQNAFGNSKNIQNVYYEGSISDWCKIQMGGNEVHWAMGFATFSNHYLFIDNQRVDDLVIPSTVETVEHGAFNFTITNSIKIEEGVKHLKLGAFSNCVGSIEIPKSVVEIQTVTGNISFPYSFFSSRFDDVYYNGTLSEWKQLITNSSIANDNAGWIWDMNDNYTPSRFYTEGNKLLTNLVIEENDVVSSHLKPFFGFKSIKNITSYKKEPDGSLYDYIIKKNLDVYIPYGTIAKYQASWGADYNYIEMEENATAKYKISIFTENSGVHFGNYVSKNGSYSSLIEVQPGYEITSITINGIESISNLDSDNILTIDNISSDKTVIISFDAQMSTEMRNAHVDKLRAWKNDGQIFVEVPNEASSLEVYDISGRRTETIGCDGYAVKTIAVNSGLYVVKVNMNDGTVLTKKL